MENDSSKRFESVYSSKVRAGRRRTYFFDVRKTKGDDYYITLTESTRRFNGEGYDRHKIFLYKEDFNRFLSSLEEVINHVKTELMPDYDYEQYERRQEEWEKQQEEDSDDDSESDSDSDDVSDDDSDESDDSSKEIDSEEDITW